MMIIVYLYISGYLFYCLFISDRNIEITQLNYKINYIYIVMIDSRVVNC